jgi:hypothetical protein
MTIHILVRAAVPRTDCHPENSQKPLGMTNGRAEKEDLSAIPAYASKKIRVEEIE